MDKTLFLIAAQFLPHADDVSITAYGNGIINDTYLITENDSAAIQSRSYILQRINHEVFVQPSKVVENMATMQDHISSKPPLAMKLQWPALLNTQAQQNCYLDTQGNSWRVMQFIGNSRSIESIENQTQAEQVGLALGHFHHLISDLHPGDLFDTLPGFHITPGYLAQYHQALGKKPNTANKDELYCHQLIAAHQHQVGVLEDAKHKGLLPLRIIHGDPKLNNFLFDQQAEKIISLIDLDTIKPGLIHYDIADCLRSCCYTKTERVSFDLDICEIILRSYIAEAKGFLTQHDFDYLYPAIELLPFELGLRFFTDYLQGNSYFKVTYPQQNLARAIDQLQLMLSIQQQAGKIKTMIKHFQNT